VTEEGLKRCMKTRMRAVLWGSEVRDVPKVPGNHTPTLKQVACTQTIVIYTTPAAERGRKKKNTADRLGSTH